jgi:hypothetical protein
VALHDGVVDHRIPRLLFLLQRVIDGAAARALLGERDQVVAGAEGAPLALDDDDVDLFVGLGPLDRGADLARHPHVDRVEAIGAVQAQARDPALVGIVGDAEAAEDRHARVSWRRSSRCARRRRWP